MPTLASDHRRSQSPLLPNPLWVWTACGVCCAHTDTHSSRGAFHGLFWQMFAIWQQQQQQQQSMFSPIFAADLRTRVRTLGDARIRIRMRIRLQFEAWQNISIIYRLIPVKHLFRFFALSTWPTASLVAIKSNLFVLFYVKTHGNTS